MIGFLLIGLVFSSVKWGIVELICVNFLENVRESQESGSDRALGGGPMRLCHLGFTPGLTGSPAGKSE